MRRGYTTTDYRDMHDRIREAIPTAAVTSDFIVGYCGETDVEFEDSLAAVRHYRFKNSFIFKYSPRPGTKAHERLADDVPEAVKRERNRLLLEAQAEASLAGNTAFVGSRQQVLVEGLSPREEKRLGRSGGTAVDDADRTHMLPQLAGRTMCDRIVLFEGAERLVGRIVEVDVVAAGPWSLSGVLPETGSLGGMVSAGADPVVAAEASGDDTGSSGPALYQLTPASQLARQPSLAGPSPAANAAGQPTRS